MLNIAFISPGKLPLPAIKGGAVEELTDILTESLSKKNNKYKITVFSVSEQNIVKYINNVEYVYIKNDGLFNQIKRKSLGILNILQNKYLGNNYINSIYKYIKYENKEYDIIIVENIPEYGMFLKKYIDTTMILHMHNNEFNQTTKNAKKIFDVYDEIYVISETVKNKILSIEKNNKVKILYNGVRKDLFIKEFPKKQIEELRKENNIEKDDIVYVFAGRLVPEKGVKELIEAFKGLAKKYKNVKLLIIGSSFFEGAKESTYIRNIKDIAKECEKSIIFTGYVNHKEIYKWYKISNVGVVPSQWEEPFALTVIEKMMCGLPLIASKSGGIKEITNNNCAKLIELDENYVLSLQNEMEKMYLSTSLRVNMSKESKKQALKFDSEIYCNIFEQYLTELLKKEGNK